MAEIITEPVEGEKKFTQAEVDAILGKRLSEERAKYPTKEEMEGYRAYKAAQQSDAEKMASITTERDTAKNDLAKATAEVERLKRERLLLGKGVASDDLEYFDFKIRQAATDGKTYETAADEFIRERQQSNVRVDMSHSMGGGNSNPTASSLMNDLIRRGARK